MPNVSTHRRRLALLLLLIALTPLLLYRTSAQDKPTTPDPSSTSGSTATPGLTPLQPPSITLREAEGDSTAEKVDVSWDEVTNADGYQMRWRAVGSNGDWESVSSWMYEPTNQHSYTISDLETGAYTLQVRALVDDDNQQYTDSTWATKRIPPALPEPTDPRWSAEQNTFFWNKVAGADGHSAWALDTAGVVGQDVPPGPQLEPDDDKVTCPVDSDQCYVIWPLVSEGDILHVQACATLVVNQNGDGICEISEEYRSSPVAILRADAPALIKLGTECDHSRYPAVIMIPDEFRLTESTNELMCTEYSQRVCTDRALRRVTKVLQYGTDLIHFTIDFGMISVDLGDLSFSDDVREAIARRLGELFRVEHPLLQKDAVSRTQPVPCIDPNQ